MSKYLKINFKKTNGKELDNSRPSRKTIKNKKQNKDRLNCSDHTKSFPFLFLFLEFLRSKEAYLISESTALLKPPPGFKVFKSHLRQTYLCLPTSNCGQAQFWTNLSQQVSQRLQRLVTSAPAYAPVDQMLTPNPPPHIYNHDKNQNAFLTLNKLSRNPHI